MIAKFENVPGDKLSQLLQYVHGEENRLDIPRGLDKEDKSVMIVRIKAITPEGDDRNTVYGVTLEIRELFKREMQGMVMVDSKYLTKVYSIVGGHSTK